MKSDEIRSKEPFELSTGVWLKEIAYQLALLNERNNVPVSVPAPQPRRRPN